MARVEQAIPAQPPGRAQAAESAAGGAGGPDDERLLVALLQRTALGELDAFEDVYRELAGPVFGLARRVILDRAQAEEVTQEVFTELWRLAARFDPARGGVRSWVLTLAHRRAVDRVRAEQSAATRMEVAGRMAPESSPPEDVAEQVEHRLEREKVRRCLRRLTEMQNEAVRLTYYTGYTQRETAELLGVPLTTVKGRLRDGLIRLRDCLGVMV